MRKSWSLLGARPDALGDLERVGVLFRYSDKRMTTLVDGLRWGGGMTPMTARARGDKVERGRFSILTTSAHSA